MTVNAAVDTLPSVSLAAHATVVLPSGKVEPEAGTHVTGRLPLTTSSEVAANVAMAPAALVASRSRLSGSVSTGPVVSWTVTTMLACVVFPASSLAEHVTVVGPRGKSDPASGMHVTVRAPPTMSVAETAKTTIAPAPLVASARTFGGAVRTGAVVSRTTTGNVSVALFVARSLAEQVTVVDPKENGDPVAGVHTAATAPSKASTAVAANVTTAPFGPVASAPTPAGTVTRGGAAASTITLNVPVAERPVPSVAEQLTSVPPTGNTELEAGAQLTGTLPPTTSTAAAVKVTTAPAVPVDSAAIWIGSVNTGARVS
jgi:hypothetical protein